MNIVIIGGSGFVGKNLIKILLTQNILPFMIMEEI